MVQSVTMPINEAWLRPVEQLVMPALENKIRVLGFTSPEAGTGVTTLARAAAEVLARSGARVLLICYASNDIAAAGATAWKPGEPGASQHIARHQDGYDVLTAEVNAQTRFLFNNAKRLRRSLVEDLADYGTIVVDLPPILEDKPDSINPLASALVCDQVVLVCANERTTRASASQAIEAARAAGVKIAGAVWNDLGVAPLGKDMARSAMSRLWFMPKVARFLERRLSRSRFLNS